MLKRILSVTVAFLIALSAFAEPALTVGNTTLTDGEVRAFAWTAGESYRETAQYYQDYLQIDYWSLTYPGGMTVEQSILTDAFIQLVTMLSLYNTACDTLPPLSEADTAACREDAESWYSELELPGFTLEDTVSLFEKQLLAQRMYALNVLATDVDAEAVEADLSPESYTVYTADYLYSIADDDDIAALMLKSGDFAETAHSDDRITCGTLTLDSSSDTQLLTAVSSLEPGETSGVIKTDYGMFLFRLTGIDTSLRAAALDKAVYEAREQAYEEEYLELYKSASYTIHDSFRSSFVLH